MLRLIARWWSAPAMGTPLPAKVAAMRINPDLLGIHMGGADKINPATLVGHIKPRWDAKE